MLPSLTLSVSVCNCLQGHAEKLLANKIKEMCNVT